jgi:hypothetical protein
MIEAEACLYQNVCVSVCEFIYISNAWEHFFLMERLLDNDRIKWMCKYRKSNMQVNASNASV